MNMKIVKATGIAAAIALGISTFGISVYAGTKWFGSLNDNNGGIESFDKPGEFDGSGDFGGADGFGGPGMNNVTLAENPSEIVTGEVTGKA